MKYGILYVVYAILQIGFDLKCRDMKRYSMTTVLTCAKTDGYPTYVGYE